VNIINRPDRTFDYQIWYYLAGPMSGLPEYNYPAFEKASIALEEQGIKVKSPHTIDHGQHEFKTTPYSSIHSCVQMVTLIDPDGREYGADCGKPADDPIHSLARGALPYQVYMKAGYRMLLNCGGIVLIQGWTQSRGAMNELFVARSLSYPVYALGPNNEFLLELPTGSEA